MHPFTKFLLFLLLLNMDLPGQCQDQMIGVQGGYSITNITSGGPFAELEPRHGLLIGITYDRPLNDALRWGGGLFYEQRGFRSRIIFTDENGAPTGASAISAYNYDYLSLPVRVTYMVGQRVHGLASVGVVPAILLNATTTLPIVDVAGELIGDQTVDVTNVVSSFDLAGLVELGAGVTVQERLLITLSALLQHSVLTISNISYFNNGQMRHYGITPTIGVRLVL